MPASAWWCRRHERSPRTAPEPRPRDRQATAVRKDWRDAGAGVGGSGEDLWIRAARLRIARRELSHPVGRAGGDRRPVRLGEVDAVASDGDTGAAEFRS